jgi:hypothetical protein
MHALAIPMSPTQLLITVGVFVVFILLRLKRISQARPLKAEQLWIVPLIFAGITALTFVQAPPTMADVPWLIGIGASGAIVGWYRGKMMRITIDPKTHALSQAASPVAMLFILAVFALRYGLRYVLGAEASAWGFSLNLLSDAPMVFAVAMFAVTRVEMFIRAERLLSEARAAHTTAPITSDPSA